MWVGDSKEVAAELAFAVAHEVGNHLSGIRMQAYLLDPDLDARSLAEASITIDELAARAGRLLSLLRPLLSDDWRPSTEETWPGLLRRVVQQIEEEGIRGVRLELRSAGRESLEAPDLEWLHSLLVALVGATIAHVGRRGTVELALEEQADCVRVVIEDDGPEEELSSTAAHRGRPLALGIARELLGRAGGCVDVGREVDRTRVALVFPIDDSREKRSSE